jgi:hypothetical protein
MPPFRIDTVQNHQGIWVNDRSGSKQFYRISALLSRFASVNGHYLKKSPDPGQSMVLGMAQEQAVQLCPICPSMTLGPFASAMFLLFAPLQFR